MKNRFNLFHRVIGRVFLWLRILRSFKGLKFSSSLNLFLSALIDIAMSVFVNPSLPRIICSGIYIVKSNPSFIVYVRGNTDDLYFLLPYREGPIDRVIRMLLKEGDIFIDVGANVGYYTLLAARRGGRVIAVEPVPETATVLRINLKLNHLDNSVQIVTKCLYKSETEMKIYIPLSKHYGLASLYHARGYRHHTITVPCTMLDKITANYDKIKLIKIDAEGAEYDILLGAESTLGKVEYLIIEISRNAKEIIEYLEYKGFQVKPLGFTTYVLAMRNSS